MKYLFLLISPLFFIGCSSALQSPQKIQDRSVVAIVHSAGQKSTYIKEHGAIQRFCGARAEDAISENATSLSLGLSTGRSSENIGESSGAGAVSLGGRDPIVLITREVLYRACEMSMNLNLDKKDTIQTYKMFLKFVQDIAKLDRNEGVQGVSSTVSSSGQTQEDSDDTDDTNDED